MVRTSRRTTITANAMTVASPLNSGIRGNKTNVCSGIRTGNLTILLCTILFKNLFFCKSLNVKKKKLECHYIQVHVNYVERYPQMLNGLSYYEGKKRFILLCL